MTFKPQHQRFRHDPANGIYGDCFRTSLAMCLGIDRDQVPHFCDGPDTDDGKWRKDAHRWLEDQGIYALELAWQNLSDAIETAKLTFFNAAVTISGRSPRGQLHECVIYQGDLIDPHPDGGGLVGPHDDGHYWMWILTWRATPLLRDTCPEMAANAALSAEGAFRHLHEDMPHFTAPVPALPEIFTIDDPWEFPQ